MKTQTTITRLTNLQIDMAGEVLARAFHDDPLFTYYLPDDTKRARLLVEL